MKSHNDSANLINPISPREYAACLRWYNRSCFFILCLIIILCCCTGYEYWQLFMLKKQHALQQPQPIQEQGDSNIFDKQLVSLQKKITLLQSIKIKKGLFTQAFNNLLMAMPDDICLGYFEYAHEKFIEISGQGRSLAAVTNFLQKFHDMPAVAHLAVSKLQPSLDDQNREYIHFILH